MIGYLLNGLATGIEMMKWHRYSYIFRVLSLQRSAAMPTRCNHLTCSLIMKDSANWLVPRTHVPGKEYVSSMHYITDNHGFLGLGVSRCVAGHCQSCRWWRPLLSSPRS